MIRKARISDPPVIAGMVNEFAARQLMLPRALSEIYESLRDFVVYERDGKVVGCGALHITWEGLGEIRSVAVLEEAQGLGIGTEMVEACLKEARQLGIKRLFVLTYAPGFFRRLGFRDCPKESLPHKIWTDCIKCPKFPHCDEEALILDLTDMPCDPGPPSPNAGPTTR